MSDKKEITEEEANKLIMGSGSGKTREVQSGMERILGGSSEDFLKDLGVDPQSIFSQELNMLREIHNMSGGNIREAIESLIEEDSDDDTEESDSEE